MSVCMFVHQMLEAALFAANLNFYVGADIAITRFNRADSRLVHRHITLHTKYLNLVWSICVLRIRTEYTTGKFTKQVCVWQASVRMTKGQ